MRGRLRTKDRKLQKLAGYRYFRASADEVDRLLDAFFPLKAAHMEAQGIANAFARPGVETFVRELCRDGVASSLIEIHALEGDGEILAIFVAITDGKRFSLMFNTYTGSDHARQSPGLILLVQVVSQCADRGLKIFDLGVGEAGYKSFFCKEPEPLFDSFLPLTAGRMGRSPGRTFGLRIETADQRLTGRVGRAAECAAASARAVALSKTGSQAAQPGRRARRSRDRGERPPAR